MRDDFDQNTKDLRAKRVGFRCSNPNCRRLTSGPQEKKDKSINIGAAAHITAAAKGGLRYNSKLSTSERKSIENGIWLCQNCAKLIDNDDKRYSYDLLIDWKKLSEQAALLEVTSNSSPIFIEDKEIIKSFAQCFDRPAFQDPFHQEVSIIAFDKAIEDTITTLNTGTLLSRDGTILHKSLGKSFLNNQTLKQNMDVIVDLLRAIRERFALGLKNKEIYNNHELIEWFDLTRIEILNIFENVCKISGVSWKQNFPRKRAYW
ncbi:MAG: HNH endonuclease [Candidatus Humimicrobiaceae bacterium]